MVIRVANERDAAQIGEIYRYYVENTAITYECHVPDEEEFAGRIRKTLSRFPYLVAEEDGQLLGYAYAGYLNTREAYDWSVECSIYVRHGLQKKGLGRALYTALENALRLQNVINVTACIAYPEQEDEYLTMNSIQYHAHLGYRMVGFFHKCSFKFGRWYGMAWMEKHIGAHETPPPPFRTFDEIRPELKEKYAIE